MSLKESAENSEVAKQAKESLSDAQMQMQQNLNHVKAGYIQPSMDEAKPNLDAVAAQTKEGLKNFGTKAAAAAMWFQTMGRTDQVSDDDLLSTPNRNNNSGGAVASSLKEGDSLLDLVGGGKPTENGDMQTISPPLNMPVSPMEFTDGSSSSELKQQKKPPESVDLLS